MKSVVATSLNQDERQEVAGWIAANLSSLPESVQRFLLPHQAYLAADDEAALRRKFEGMYRELRRAMGIIPSSERRRSGHPLAAIPQGLGSSGKGKQEKLEQQLDRTVHLGVWHDELARRHTDSAIRIEEKLAKMKTASPLPHGQVTRETLQALIDETPLEVFEPTEEEKAEILARAQAFAERMQQGDGADPELTSVNETLMPGGVAVLGEKVEMLSVVRPEDAAEVEVLKTLTERRVRYDIALAVKRIELEVEKKVVVKENGERTVICASTEEHGPPRFSVTWSALATLAVLVGQFALPMNRLATMLSVAGKRFTAGSLSRMLHYVAERLLPIYLTLAEELADSEILAGDDTSCRVIEVGSYFSKCKAKGGHRHPEKKKPPWVDYGTKAAAEASIQRCEERRQARIAQRAAGDRDAVRTVDEQPSLGMLIGRVLEFESPRQDGQGGKQSMNTTVITGRSVAQDPRSLIVFYRSHLGGCGNLLEAILQSRSPRAGDVIVQADLSTTNLVRDPKLLERFKVTLIGCSAHSRRPFALYEHEDPVSCPHMLHLFTGLAMHEERLDVHGRNRENVLAVRQTDSRRIWDQIKELATKMTLKWSPATKLGSGARYILKHFDKLTAYLDDPRLEPNNNLQERMLRTEKLIENSSMFRRTLEGRFVLDIIRTVLQTAVAADVSLHDYLVSVLRSDPNDITHHPERFTPRAWASRNTPA